MNMMEIVWDVILLYAGGLALRSPELSRPGIFFGVTVEPGFASTTEGMRIRLRYRRSILAVTAVALLVNHLHRKQPALGLLSYFIYFVGFYSCWILASRQTRRFSTKAVTVRSASLKREE